MELARDEFLARSALSLNQHRKIRLGDPLQALAKYMHDGSGPDQWWRRCHPTGTGRATPSRGLQDQASQLRRRGEQLDVLFVQPPAAVEGRLKDSLDLGVGRRDPKYDRLGGPGRCN